MKNQLIFAGLYLFFGISNATIKTGKFSTETVGQRLDIAEYKKIGTSSYFGLRGRNSKFKCAEVCNKQDSCESFHLDGGACVFGVSGDNTAFREGERANPNSEQRIQVKGMCFLNCLIENKYVQTCQLLSG